MSRVEEQPCGCIVQHVDGGEIVARFCADHLISKDPFGVIPRRPVGPADALLARAGSSSPDTDNEREAK